MAIPEEKVLRGIYGDAAKEAEARFEKLQGTYEAQFGQEELTCFSAPGRTEIIGNHTDHNGGKILAASITMDTIAVAAKTGDSVVTILSEGYPDPIVVDTDHLEKIPKCQGSLSLVGGMLKAARDEFGYRIGGFNACVSTQVISSAGVSSSASFEMLVCAILNEFFNGGSIDYAHYARIGQYAENRYWDKASGLMDQMACAVGGTIYLDFGGGEVKYEKVDFGLSTAPFRRRCGLSQRNLAARTCVTAPRRTFLQSFPRSVQRSAMIGRSFAPCTTMRSAGVWMQRCRH